MNNAEIDWNKEFLVNSICRADVKETGFPEEQIALLTDEDMQAIAQKMADWYNGYCPTRWWTIRTTLPLA